MNDAQNHNTAGITVTVVFIGKQKEVSGYPAPSSRGCGTQSPPRRMS